MPPGIVEPVHKVQSGGYGAVESVGGMRQEVRGRRVRVQVRAVEGLVPLPQLVQCLPDRLQDLRGVLDASLLIRITAEIDVVHGGLHDEDVDQDRAVEADVRPGDGDDDSWAGHIECVSVLGRVITSHGSGREKVNLLPGRGPCTPGIATRSAAHLHRLVLQLDKEEEPVGVSVHALQRDRIHALGELVDGEDVAQDRRQCTLACVCVGVDFASRAEQRTCLRGETGREVAL